MNGADNRQSPLPLQPGVNAGPNSRLRRRTPVNGRGPLSCIAPFLLAVVACLAGCSQLPADGTGAAKDDGKGTATADSKKVWHWPKVTVSKETTYFTEPLRADGSVDYVAAFNRRCSRGVTPENNAAVVLWRVCGPSGLDKPLRKPYFKLLGIAELPEKGNYLACYDDFPEYKAAEKQPDKGEAFAIKAWQDYSAAADAPWAKTDYPLWAAVLRQNEKLLDTLDEGLQRPRFYSPLVVPMKGDAMLLGCDAIAYKVGARFAMRLLKLRAMLRIHDGDTNGAWRDIVALYRIGRLSCQEPFLIVWLAFGMCDDMAGEAAVTLSQQKGLTAKQARECQEELLRLPPMRSLGDFCDQEERCEALETLTLLADSKGPDSFFSIETTLDYMCKQWDPSWSHGEEERKRRADAFRKLAAKNDVDWTEVFRQYNLFRDQLAKACGHSIDAQTVEAVKKLEAEAAAEAKETMDTVLSGDPSSVEKMSPVVKAQHVARLAVLPGPLRNWRMAVYIEQKREARQRMVMLAFALAGYRADRHEYPKALADLVPAYIDALPKDPFSDGELHYKSENSGYLLYSVGKNGKDDGGRRADWVRGQPPSQDWDDISIQTPARTAK